MADRFLQWYPLLPTPSFLFPPLPSRPSIEDSAHPTCWDVVAGHDLHTKKICRTFSDCTTAPRNGIISGCYPLDDHYKKSTMFAELKVAKAGK